MKGFADYLKEVGEIGYVEEVERSMYIVSGLPQGKPEEIIITESGEMGQIFSVSENSLEALFYSKAQIKVGTKVTRTGRFMEVPVGQELLGRTLDPLGVPLVTNKPFTTPQTYGRLDVRPAGIDQRIRIGKTLETGVTVVDLIVPLGKGQRELIIGDRKTGKTAFLMQTILHQARLGTICIYVGIGKKTINIKKVEEYMVQNNIMQNCIIIASTSQDPASIVYLTPYTAMTISEYFRDQGYDVLLILDDMTTHAKYYREISLLGKRFPGRNSYPGDIFFAHARLMERAGNFKTEKGEHSITCLPVVETMQGDLSGYIQTNVMSMTDGHLYFDSDLFTKGRRPAVNPFLSVTRVGRQTQTNLRRAINRELLSFLTLHEKMQNFIHFGAELNISVRNTLAMGDKVIGFFEQQSNSIIPVDLQMFLFSLIWIDTWNGRSQQVMKHDLRLIMESYLKNNPVRESVKNLIEKSQSFNDLLNGVRKNLDTLLKELNVTITPITETKAPTPPAAAQPIPVSAPSQPAQTTAKPAEPTAAPPAQPQAEEKTQRKENK